MAISFRLVPADRFTTEELTQIYNGARADYLVPMPMSVAHMQEYIDTHDIDLASSVVATDGKQKIGLGLLGVRPGRAWVTRMGVLPSHRRHGIGEAILRALIAASERLGIGLITLEVIKDNHAAQQLFLKWGFRVTRELIVLRRPAGPPRQMAPATFRWVDKAEALALAGSRPQPLSWVNDVPSLANAAHVLGLTAALPDGSSGWLVLQKQPSLLTRMTIGTLYGDPIAVCRALLAHLYERFPGVNSNIENVDIANPHLPAFYEAGFFEAFRRLEMYRE